MDELLNSDAVHRGAMAGRAARMLAGTAGADTLEGSELDDTLDGLDGDDRLNGNGGNDLLFGGAGNDRLDGGAGSDQLDGGEGNDELLGGAGGDNLHDGAGNNTLRGGDGDDMLDASSPGLNVLYGDAGNDYLVASRGDSLLDGGAGNDLFQVWGATYTEATRTVEARGGDGDDTFHLAIGNAPTSATLFGGSGVDTYVPEGVAPLAAASVADFTTGAGGDIIDITRVSISTTGNPFAPGGSARLVQRGADTVLQVRSSAGDPSIFQEALLLRKVSVGALTAHNFAFGFNPDGSSTGLSLTGTGAADRLSGGWLDDTLDGRAGNDILKGAVGNDLLLGGDGDDQLDGDAADTLPPTTFNWEGKGGDDRLEGGAGNDTLASRWGNDVLLGGAGNDLLQVTIDYRPGPAAQHGATLDGGDGNDHLQVSGGPQRGIAASLTASITGGAGIDTFELLNKAPEGSWTILDFQAGAGGDLLDLDGSFAWSLQSPFANGWLRLEQRGADTVILADYDGSGKTYATIDLVVLKNVVKETVTAANILDGYLPDGTPFVIAPQVIGNAGGERMEGDGRSNIFFAEGGSDVLAGYAGNDLLDGGDGLDTALYTGARADYAVRYIDTGRLYVADLRAGPHDGVDSVNGIERLVFADTALALDTGLDGVAGQAYRIYRAAFDRTPDQAGLGFWIAGMDRGTTLVEVAAGFVGSQEFITLYGAAPTNAEIVTRLYQNILHRQPEQAGYDYWLNALDKKLVDLPTVLTQFSQSSENVLPLVDLLAEGVAYQPYG